MGMYTRLSLNVAIRDTAPIIEELQLMVKGVGSHDGRRAWLFNSSSYYHDAIQAVSFEHDSISKCWKLSVCCDLKNYENEIEWFLEFIAPHVETESLAGYSLYEEDISPTLIWFREGALIEFIPALPASLGFEQ